MFMALKRPHAGTVRNRTHFYPSEVLWDFPITISRLRQNSFLFHRPCHLCYAISTCKEVDEILIESCECLDHCRRIGRRKGKFASFLEICGPDANVKHVVKKLLLSGESIVKHQLTCLGKLWSWILEP
jgi:hypothetical protein